MSITRLVVGAALVTSVAASSVLASPTPQQLLDQMAARFSRVNDYEVTIDSTSSEGSRPCNVRYRYAFKKPNMVRLRTLSGENKDGELVCRPDGTIRGRKNSGLIKVFALTMSRSDKRLRDSEGVGVWEMDHGAAIQRLKASVGASGNRVAVTPSGGDHVLEIRFGAGALAGAVDRYWIDGETLMINRRERSRNNVVTERDTYSDLRINPGFTPAYFEF